MVTYTLEEDRSSFTGNADTIGSADTRDNGIGTEITTTGTYNLGKITVQMKKVNSPTVGIKAYCYSDSGALPNTLLATSTTTIDPSTLSTSYTAVDFEFPAGVTLSTTTKYWFTFKRTDSGYDGTNNQVLDGLYNGAATGLKTVQNGGAGWSQWTNNWAYSIMVYSQPSSIGVQINIGDAWKEISAVQINIGDSWKTVDGMQINIGDVWKTIF